MRIVAVSDLHGYLPDIPACDLLIVAGDICPDRFGPCYAKEQPTLQAAWFGEVVRPWLAAAPATRSILTWGNHDWCGVSPAGADGVSAQPSDDRVTILVDSMARVDAGESSMSVWATPWSNQFMHWAFMKPPSELAGVYASIPAGIDILISHQPPFGCGDRFVDAITGRIDHLGSRQLLETIERVRPRLVVCGHIHNGHGRYVHAGVPIYNVSIVDEQYRHVYAPTIIDLNRASARGAWPLRTRAGG